MSMSMLRDKLDNPWAGLLHFGTISGVGSRITFCNTFIILVLLMLYNYCISSRR